jgi:hypothetical protein
VTEARRALSAETEVEWATPVLFMRVADGRVFDLAELYDREEAAASRAPVTPHETTQARGAQSDARTVEPSHRIADEPVTRPRSGGATGPPPSVPPPSSEGRHVYPPRRRRARRVVAAVAILAAALAAVFFAVNHQATGSAPPAQVNPVPDERVGVSATSTLADANGFTYAAHNTLDHDPCTAWNDATGVGPAGESLTYSFRTPRRIVRVDVIGEYIQSKDAYFLNARIKDLKITSDHRETIVKLPDKPQWTYIRFDFGVTRKIVLKVSEVYYGTAGDSAVTEAQFWSTTPGSALGPGWIPGNPQVSSSNLDYLTTC